MIGAVIFLVALVALIGKMVWDVQKAKKLQIFSGIKTWYKNKEIEESASEFPGVDVEGIEKLAERFQKLAHIKKEQ